LADPRTRSLSSLKTDSTGSDNVSNTTHISPERKNWSPMLRFVLTFSTILFTLMGCGQAPDPTSTVTGKPDTQQLVQNARRPEITTEKIAGDIVGKKVTVSELTGDGADVQWTFEASEFRQVNILEKNITNTGLTLVIFMTTRNNPKPDKAQIHASGKLELQYEWKAGQWVLATAKNLTFRYTVGGPT
jgi:hypothetical protein